MASLEQYEKYVDLGGSDEKAREKVALWKQVKQGAMSIPTTVAAPTEAEEDAAAKRHQEAMRLLQEEDRVGALVVIQELLGKYGHTKYVRDQARGFKAILKSFK